MKTVLLLALAAAVHSWAATVSGRAVNSATGAALAEVVIVLEGESPTGSPPQVDSYIVETDGEGAFRADNVAPGRYRAHARKEGFAAPRAAARLLVETGAAPDPLVIALTPLGAVSGRIVDPEGDPIAGASVSALTYAWKAGKKRLTATATARTDDRGEYRIFGLAPGRYYVRASHAFGAVGSSTRFMQTGGGPRVDHVYGTVYFPAGAEPEGASEVTLAPGAEVRNLGMQLRPQSLYRIRARVVGVEPGTRGLTFSFSDYSAESSGMSMAFSGAGGSQSMSLPLSRPGRYLVGVSDREHDLQAQQLVTLVDQDVEVTLTLAPPVGLSGVVRLEAGDPMALAFVNLALEGEDPWSRGASGKVGDDGRFTIAKVSPATYWLRISPPRGYYVKSMSRNGRPLAAPRLDLAASMAPIAVTLATDGGAIEGVAAPDAAVVLEPKGPWREWPDRLRSATADRDGRFSLRDIAPGEYLFFAFDGAPPGAPAAAEFRRAYEKQATAVTVEAGARQTVKATAIAP
jgi:hypothetical protein